MKKRIIRGATEKEVLNKKFNVYLGISLGNKWFDEKNMEKSIKYGLSITKERFGLLIADTLHAINYEVRDKRTHASAIKKAIRKGEEIESILKKIIHRLPEEDRARVDIIKWDEVINSSPRFKKEIALLYDLFEENIKFKRAIERIVLKYLNEKDRKRFNEKEITRLCHYILEEMPEIISGFKFGKVNYDAYIYPYDGDLTKLIEKIQQNKLFPELAQKGITGKKVFISMEKYPLD